MARPTKPKDAKPKAEGEEAEADAPKAGVQLDIKFIVTILAIFVASIAGSAASTYFLAPMAIIPQVTTEVLTALNKFEESSGEEGGHKEAQHIMNLELDEFTVNLKTDPAIGGNQFLRTKMSLSVGVPMEEYCDPHGAAHASLTPNDSALISQAESGEGTIAGAAANISNTERLIASGGGSKVDPFVACQQAFNKNMARFVPTLRDIINQSLMKRTAGTLASIEGQEALKDEIITEANHLLGDHYSLTRVNFSDFIIQY